jgi:CRISPR-associated protein Csm2
MSRHQPRMDNEVVNIIGKIKQLKMLKDLDPKAFADEDGYANTVASKIKWTKTSQLYKFFASIRNIQKQLKETKDWNGVRGDFYLLKPKIAYAKGRRLVQSEFHQVLMALFSKVDIGSNEDKIQNFNTMVEFLEAILAFHKFLWG